MLGLDIVKYKFTELEELESDVFQNWFHFFIEIQFGKVYQKHFRKRSRFY